MRDIPNLRISAVAKQLGKHPDTIKKWARGIRVGKHTVQLQTARIGALLMTSQAWVDEFLQACEMAGGMNKQLAEERTRSKARADHSDALAELRAEGVRC
ncbi:MAG: DUF1580 domain-containing protein [Gemmataceae bacterium]